MDYHDDISTTLTPEINDSTSTQSATLQLYDIFIPLLGLFIISLNLLVVISSGLLLKKRQQPRSTYLFLGNVGLSDLLTGIAVLFGHFYPTSLRSDLQCAIHMGMIVSSTLVSVLSVLLVAIDRFFFILYGLQYQRYIFPNRARILIATTWIIGLLVGFIPAMAPMLRGTMNGQRCWFISMLPEYVLSTTIIGIIPVFVVLILYSFILYQALKKVSDLKKATSSTSGTETANNLRYFRGSTVNLEQDLTVSLRDQSKTRRRCLCCCRSKETSDENAEPSTKRKPSKLKAIKIVSFTTGSFVVTWLPYFIASTMFVYCDHENNESFCQGLKVAIASPLAILGFSNSLLNPIIYAWWHNGFRSNSIRILSKQLEKVSCCRCCLTKSDENFASPRITNLSSMTQSMTTLSDDINRNNINTGESADGENLLIEATPTRANHNKPTNITRSDSRE